MPRINQRNTTSFALQNLTNTDTNTADPVEGNNTPSTGLDDTANDRNTQSAGDRRFIASRASSLSSALHHDVSAAKFEGAFDERPTRYRERLTLAMFGHTYAELANASVRDLSFQFNAKRKTAKSTPYQITAGSVQDAPDMVDDYYSNGLCRNASTIFIALQDGVYSYHQETKAIGTLIERTDENAEPGSNTVTALGCDANWLLCSANKNLQIFDLETAKLATTIRDTGQFTTIVGGGRQIFYLCSRSNSFIARYDIRSPRITKIKEFPDDRLISLSFNDSFGASNNLDGNNLAVSCATSNTVQLYNIRNVSRPTNEFTHLACSKAMAFSPMTRGLLLSAGGIGDNSLNLWNTTTGALLAKTTHEAQITNVHWLDEENIFVTEGYLSNKVSSWFIENGLFKRESTTGAEDGLNHQNRVLVSAQNPKDRGDIVTASPDETLRFWSVRNGSKPLDSEDQEPKRHRPAFNPIIIR